MSDDKRVSLKRRIEDLGRQAETATKCLKKCQESIAKLQKDLETERENEYLLQMHAEDMKTLEEIRKKELAKLDADKLFQDTPNEPKAPAIAKTSARSSHVIEPAKEKDKQ